MTNAHYIFHAITALGVLTFLGLIAYGVWCDCVRGMKLRRDRARAVRRLHLSWNNYRVRDRRH